MSNNPEKPLEIGKIYDDMICEKMFNYNDPKNPYYGKSNSYLMRCTICGRTKIKLRYVVLRHEGTFHRDCGHFEKQKDIIFYKRWRSMRDRTTNKNKPEAHRYVNRNINSDVWKNFIDFYDDMYDSWCKVKEYIPVKYITVERIENDKSYCKENCKWVHYKDQYKNKSLNNLLCITNIKTGEKEYIQCAKQWCERNNLYPRLAECALRTKTHTRDGYHFERISSDEYYEKRSISEQFNAYTNTERLRVEHEMDFDNAITYDANDFFNIEKIGETEYIFK